MRPAMRNIASIGATFAVVIACLGPTQPAQATPYQRAIQKYLVSAHVGGTPAHHFAHFVLHGHVSPAAPVTGMVRGTRLAAFLVLGPLGLAAASSLGEPASAAGSTPLTGNHRLNRGLDVPRKKNIAMELVSSAENSSLDWRA